VNSTKLIDRLQGTVRARFRLTPSVAWCTERLTRHASKVEGLSNKARGERLITLVVDEFAAEMAVTDGGS
jgi:hypothetical protein